MSPDDASLAEAICRATRIAASRLFQETQESFYYFALITSGEAHAPIVSAWSRERSASLPEHDRQVMKWSYADSPYCDYGAELFAEVRDMFSQRPSISTASDQERTTEYEARLRAMESALAKLDKEGLFGRGEKRNAIVINVEVMPPDPTNTERAMRLNPAPALADWLAEAAE